MMPNFFIILIFLGTDYKIDCKFNKLKFIFGISQNFLKFGTRIALTLKKTKNMKKIILSTFVFLFAFALVSNAQTKGQKLPGIEIKDLSGNSVDISKYSENKKITVISFWATWCVPCKKELNNIAELYEEWTEEYDVELVAISIDDSRNMAKVKTYINGQGWEFEVLLDANSDLKRALNFQTVPYTLLVDQDGNIVYRHTGYVEGDEYILEEEIAKIAK